MAPQPQQGTPMVKPPRVPGSSRHRRDVSSPSTTEGSRRRERSEKSARWISSCNCADLEKQLKGLLFPYYCEAFLAAILLWFGRYPSAGIILVKGYIAAEHSFGAGTESAPGSPSHHARAGDAPRPRSSLFPSPILHGRPLFGLIVGVILGDLAGNPRGSVTSITGLLGPFPTAWHQGGQGTSDIPGAHFPCHEAARLSSAPGLVSISSKVRLFSFHLFFF